MKSYKLFVENYTVYNNDSGAKFWGNKGAGALIFSKSTNRFLVLHRSKYVNEPSCYGTIGGKIDENESVENSVKREITEECGYNGDLKLIPLYIFKAKGFEYHNFLGIVENEFKPEMDWESDGYKWLTFEELLKIEPKHFGLVKLLEDGESINIIENI